MNRPFDAKRYKRLLKGLEVSEIKLSALENSQTIGAEYYAPEFLNSYKRLLASILAKTTLAKACPLITDGDHGSADYVDADAQGVAFVLSEAVEPGRINLEACRKISLAHAKTLERSKLRVGDVLVTKTGVYFGKSAVVEEAFAGANTIAHVGLLRPRKEVDPYFLSTFLNCKYGQAQLRRRGIKATRPEIKLLEFRHLRASGLGKAGGSNKVHSRRCIQRLGG